MLGGGKKFILGFLFFSLAVGANAAKEPSFHRKYPWCERGFMGRKKISPDLNVFVEALNGDSSKFEIRRLARTNTWMEHVELQKLLLQTLQRFVTDAPFGQQDSEARARYLTWGLAVWMNGIRESSRPEVQTAVDNFLSEAILGDKSFSAADLNRIEHGFAHWVSGSYHVEILNRIEQWKEKLAAEVALRKSRGNSLESWNQGLDELVTPAGGLRGTEELEAHALHSAKLLKDSGLPIGESKKTMMKWIKDLQKIDSVYFRSVLNVFAAFRSVAREMDFTEENFEEVRNYFRAVVMKRWQNNSAAMLAADAEVPAPLRPRELPQ
jgi:hypothetical protein